MRRRLQTGADLNLLTDSSTSCFSCCIKKKTNSANVFSKTLFLDKSRTFPVNINELFENQ